MLLVLKDTVRLLITMAKLCSFPLMSNGKSIHHRWFFPKQHR